MSWKFWKQEKSKEGEVRLPGPKSILTAVGTHMVVREKKNPEWVWKLKGVFRPAEKEKVFHWRVFDEARTEQAGVKVKDWNSLDGHPDLIVWEGYFDKKTHSVRSGKFVESSSASN